MDEPEECALQNRLEQTCVVPSTRGWWARGWMHQKPPYMGGGGFSGHRQGSRRHRRPVVWLTESLRRDERLVDETRERRPTREMSRKKEKPSLKRNFNPLYRIEQKPCSPPKVVHALLHAQEVLHVLSEVAENFEISSTLPHHRPSPRLNPHHAAMPTSHVPPGSDSVVPRQPLQHNHHAM